MPLSPVVPDTTGGEVGDHFMGSRVPFLSDRFGRQAGAEQNNLISGFVVGTNLYERGLHADFEDFARCSIDQAWAFSQAVGVAAEDHAEARSGEVGVAGGA